MITAALDPLLEARITASWPIEGVFAGSALVWRRGRLLVVQDSASAVILVDPATRAVERLVLEAPGLPLPKGSKPDFEAVAAPGDGTVYVLGSGSTAARRRVARISSGGEVAIRNAGAIYDAVAERLDATPNVEGAVILQDGVLRLLHRGSRSSPSASLDLDPGCLEGRPAAVVRESRYDLGRAGGVPLAFTDAEALPGGRMLYLAVAEDTPSAVDDGPIAGAAIGVVEGAEARYAPLLEADGTPSVRKMEGVALAGCPRSGGASGWLVTDPDDPDRPAELCRLELGGRW